MSFQLRNYKGSIGIVATLLMIGASAIAIEPQPLSLEGTWIMASAYEILADGTRTTNYGEHPNGLMMVDKAGRYSIQIFHPNRPKFASGDKRRVRLKNIARPYWVRAPTPVALSLIRSRAS